MDTRKTHTITVTQEAWDNAGIIAHEMNISRSRLFEMMVGYLQKAEIQSFGDFLSDVLKDVSMMIRKK